MHLGKAGAPIAAWSEALASMMTLALAHGATIRDLIVQLSSLVTDRIRSRPDGRAARSAPEGVALALFDYARMKQNEVADELGFDRPPRMARRDG